MATTVTAGELRERLDDYGDHVPVVIVLRNGEHAVIEEIENANGTQYNAVGLAVGTTLQPGDDLN